MALLTIENLRTHFPTPDGLVRAVDGVSLEVEAGSAIGIVGESGSGKTVLNLSVMGLVPSPPAIIEAGSVRFEGEDLRAVPPERLRQIRGNRIAMIFQDPMTSLNPFLTIGDQLSEPLLVHKGASKSEARERVVELLGEVGIPEPKRALDVYPHHFSGGMRQRAMIAMALACDPTLLIADEPTTALDVTIQAQILELLQRIRREHGTAIVFITHDLGIAAGFCDEIFVMYAGKIVEHAPTGLLFESPAHPYTRALLESVPRLDVDTKDTLNFIRGAPPDLTRLPPGCSFAPRCSFAVDQCHSERPLLQQHQNGRSRACFVDIDGRATP